MGSIETWLLVRAIIWLINWLSSNEKNSKGKVNKTVKKKGS